MSTSHMWSLVTAMDTAALKQRGSEKNEKNVSEFFIFLHTFENWKSFEPEIGRWESFVLFFNPNMKNNVDCYGNDFLASQKVECAIPFHW